MITVIDQPRENLYEGMSVSDTLDNMVIGVYEACNDFMMDTLLTEHSYLYENATEITYVNEDGSDNANGASLKEKFFTHVDNVRKIIGDAISKVLEAIGKKVDAIRDKIIALGINKKKLDQTIAYISSHDVNFSYKLSGWSQEPIRNLVKQNFDKFINKDNIDSATFYKAGDLYKELDEKAKKMSSSFNGNTKNYSATGLSKCVDVVLNNTFKKDLSEAKKKADKSLESLKKSISSPSADKGELIGERLGRLNDALKCNVNINKDLLKAYYNSYNECVSVIVALIKIANKGIRDEAINKAKENIKNSPNKFKKGLTNAKANAKATVARAAYNANKKNPKFVDSESSDEFDED